MPITLPRQIPELQAFKLAAPARLLEALTRVELAHDQALALLNFARDKLHRRIKAIENYFLLDLLDELKGAVRLEI